MPDNHSGNAPARVSAQEIYSLMQPFALTAQQQAAVEQAAVNSPSLVVAGAGSGKTELMAVRVLWLVANGYATPEQILGLTFTRKAASELSNRIFKNLLVLRDSKFWPAGLNYDFAQPTVTTYNSYANSLFRDYALGLGYESESTLITEAAAFQLARDVVLRYGSQVDSRLADLDLNLDSVVKYVLEMAADMNDNLVDSAQVEAVTTQVLERITDLPKKPGSNDFSKFAYYDELLEPFPVTVVAAKLADAYRQEKHRLGYVDYSDQVALAERAVREIPEVKVRERQRFPQVLLDEYQDTSFLQTRLLANLFGHQSVFAVGDPNQSIYGWRGASASNLSSFGTDFASGFEGQISQNKMLTQNSVTLSDQTAPTEPVFAKRFELATSWRNPKAVLTLANHLAEPLRSPASFLPQDQWQLQPVALNARQDASQGVIGVAFEQDLIQEAQTVADWFAKRMQLTQDQEKRPTAALLMRNRRNMPIFLKAMQDKGLSVEVIGLGGLLEVPEIVDLVSALHVVHDPTRGSELVRLLTGARWRIGAKDIDRLHRFAKSLNRYFADSETYSPEDGVSLVDALDQLLDERQVEFARIPEPALSRFQNAARVFANLRKQTGLPLPEFVRAVEQELWLDIEVVANPSNQHPMAHLNAFSNIVSGYAGSNLKPNLGAFLRWLEFANDRERFEVPSAVPEQGVIQLQTIHSAKGLEWDFVAIANLVEGDFPVRSRNTKGWLSKAKLPFPLRGDRPSLPSWNFLDVSSQPELKKSVDAFSDQMRVHNLREELRLMYVAVTRPKRELLLTGSYWKPTSKSPMKPSPYLLSALELDSSLTPLKEWEPEDSAKRTIPQVMATANPLQQEQLTLDWPLEPIGPVFAPVVQRAKEQTLSALVTPRGALQKSLQRDLDLLLGERVNNLSRLNQVELPIRVNASGFKDYVLDAEKAAAKILRPVPEAPYQATRAGTIFHNMMEERFAHLSRALATGGNIDDLGLEIAAQQVESVDLVAHKEKIAELQANFAQSEWANQQPAYVEIEIQLAVENNIFICKLDAVFQTADGFEVVDWKTGASPKGQKEEDERVLQLALYRVAFAALKRIPIERVSACLYYVEENRVIRRTDLDDLPALLKRWKSVAS
ncbi:MAG: UvrD-helicase domain-containing protein [Micrococcales bacterium]